MAAFAINLDTTIVNVALPALVRQLHATDTQLQWVVDAYNLSFAALILPAGSLSDRLGRKGMLLAGLGLFAVSSLVGGLATTPSQLIADRAVMGVAAAMIFPSTLSLITSVFNERVARAQAIGAWGASAGAAIALGPIVGGWLIEISSWSAIFYALVPVALIGAALVVRFVPPSRDPDPAAVDLGGYALSSAAMAVAVFSLIEAPSSGWASARTLGGLALGVGLGGVFVWWESRRAQPMLDMALFRNKRFTAASGSVTVAFFTLFGFIFLMTQYFQFIRSYSPLMTGVRLLPVAASVGVASVLGTKLAVRAGTRLVVAGGLVFITAFYMWVSAVISTHTSYGVIAAQMVVYGIGMGLTSAPATESIMGAVRADQAGVGSAVNDATRLLGGTLGVAVIGSIFTSLYSSRLTARAPHGLPAAALDASRHSIGEAYAVGQRLQSLHQPGLARALHQAGDSAFVHGISVGCAVAAGVAAAGVLLAARFMPAQPLLLPADGAADGAEPVALPVTGPVAGWASTGTVG